jgi:DNA topoisomerase-1
LKDKFTRVIGIDPKTNFEVVTYIGKYGPLVQLKNTTNLNNSKFAPLGDIKMEEVTLSQSLELLKYPYKFCDINKKDVLVCKGKFGVYLKYNGKNISLGKDDSRIEETDLTRKNIKDLINNVNNKPETKNMISTNIKINDMITVKNGKFGYYISFDNNNISIKYSKQFKSLNKTPEELTINDCDKIIKEYLDYKNKKK